MTDTSPKEKEMLDLAVAQGNTLLPQLIELSRKAPSPESARFIAEIHGAMQAIYADFVKDPRDLDVIRDFTEYYAPHAPKLIETYIGLLKESPQQTKLIDETKKTLDELYTMFTQMLLKCGENDRADAALHARSVGSILGSEHPEAKQ